jgi:hypothetical protein
MRWRSRQSEALGWTRSEPTLLVGAAAHHLESHGKPYDALAMASHTLSLADAAWGPSDRRTLTYRNNKAVQLLALGRADETIPLLEDIVSRAESVHFDGFL